jgi:hypothetical protein
MLDRIQRWWRRRSEPVADGKGAFDNRVDNMTAARGDDAARGVEGGSIPPHYLPTGVDEGRPKK